MEETKNYELRMYGCVPYNLSDKQKLIQFGHAVVEYSLDHYDEQYLDFARNHKTFIALNGGTTNNDGSGTLQQIQSQLKENNIKFSSFYEPDLNNALTAVVFLVDERVYNYEKYPDFVPYISKLGVKGNSSISDVKIMSEREQGRYNLWVNDLGGEKNAFLRELLRNKKLA